MRVLSVPVVSYTKASSIPRPSGAPIRSPGNNPWLGASEGRGGRERTRSEGVRHGLERVRYSEHAHEQRVRVNPLSEKIVEICFKIGGEDLRGSCGS